jgi:hypothetical protein
LSPRLSSLWVGLVTPIPSSLARPLIDSLVNEVVVTDASIDGVVPHEPMTCREGIRLALQHVKQLDAANHASATEPIRQSPADPIASDPQWSGATVLVDRQDVRTNAPPRAVYREVCALGGEHGWLVGDWLWDIRGWLDILAGGTGMRRGRRHPTALRIGDIVDFWRVEALEPGALVRLRAEMRLPGDAWLEWRIDTDDCQQTRLIQRALFRPRGLFGRLYWYAVAPFHRFIFGPLARTLVERALVDSCGERSSMHLLRRRGHARR